MTGISLSISLILGEPTSEAEERVLADFSTSDAFLLALYAAGARSVELRPVSPAEDPERVLAACRRLRDFGFSATVHGALESAAGAAEEIFAPLRPAIREGLLRGAVIVVHPLARMEDTAAALRALCAEAKREDPTIRIALENPRKFPGGECADTTEWILQTVEAAGCKGLGICFDFGHLWYNLYRDPTADPGKVPSRAFLDRVIHTHIHGIGGEGSTHFPPREENVPLKEWMDALCLDGVYNTEPEPKRWADDPHPGLSMVGCVRSVAAHVPLCASARAYLRRACAGLFSEAARALDASGDAIALCNASGYFFKIGALRGIMDPALPLGMKGAPLPELGAFGTVKYGFLTHAHGDHADPRVLAHLAALPIRWVVPDFMCEIPIPEEKILRVRAGDVLDLDGVRVKVLAGHHFRPETRNGIDCVGYLFDSGEKTILFPSDTRDYAREDTVTPCGVDVLVAHLWTGDRTAQVGEPTPECVALAEWALAFRPRRIFLSHLYETSRDDASLWSARGAGICADEIFRRDPAAEVTIPRIGRVYEV